MKFSSSTGGWLAFLVLASAFHVCRAEKPEPNDILLFMFFGIGVGVIFMQVLNRIGDPVPFTVVVFMAGVLFSLANKDSTGLFGESIKMWVNIDADLLLYIFLPPLVYGEAMSLNWYHAKVAFPQSLVLAGPGVLIGAVLMGCFAKGIFPQWSWYLSMTFGAISAATDTVAVVSLLKSAGASPKLTMIIVGESLLNDGVAIVLFTVFNNLLNGDTYTFGSLLLFVVESCIGSVFVGVAFGLITVRWLRTANRPVSEIDVLVQTAITLVSAYMTFFIAQNVLEISGALACVTAGAMVAWLGPPVILNHETLHNVWGMAEWVFNTLIFLLAGLIIGNRVFALVRPVEWVYLVVLYIMLMIIRFFVIFISFPILSNVGHKCSWQDAVFMGWGGLRGALGMALALITYRNGPEELESQTSALFFYVGGMAAITIVVNATTSNFVLRQLDLVGVDSAEKKMVIASIKKKLKKHMRASLAQLASEFRFSEQEVDEVRQSVSLLNGVSMDDINKEVAEIRKLHEEKAKARRSSLGGSLYPHSGTGRGDHSPRAGTPDHVNFHNRPPTPEQVHAHQLHAYAHSTPADRAKRSDSVTNPLHAAFSLEKPTEIPSTTTRSNRRGSISPRNSSDVRPGSPLHYSTIKEEEEGEEEGFDVIARLEAGNNHRGAPSPGPGRLRRNSSGILHRSLSMSARNPHHVITPDLLAYVRSTFLSMVRVRYWNDIERGKIPRKSKSGKFLLYSVEVGIDEAHLHVEAGMRDWPCIEEKLDYYPLEMRMLTYWEEHILGVYVPEHWVFSGPSHYLNRRECTREERMVYILTSFIAAHEHAQRKIHGFLKVEDEEEEWGLELQSLEELKVIAESKLSVAMARRRLDNVNPETVRAIRTKQAGALILTEQAEAVKHMVDEGLLKPKDAEEIIAVINSDMQGINEKRNKMYQEHGASTTHRRKAMHKLEERNSMELIPV